MQGAIPLSKVESAVLYRFPEGAGFDYRWGYEFPGFPRTYLQGPEARQIIEELRSSPFFFSLSDIVLKESLEEILKSSAFYRWETIEALQTPAGREKLKERIQATLDFKKKESGALEKGALRIRLQKGGEGIVFFYLTGDELLVEARYKNYFENLFGINAQVLSRLRVLMKKAKAEEVPALFPELNASQAAASAKDKFGEVYTLSEKYIRDSEAVRGIFGEIRELRPAQGRNETASWMDFSAVFTFKVVGEKSTGAALITWGDENVSGEVVSQGRITRQEPKNMPWFKNA